MSGAPGGPQLRAAAGLQLLTSPEWLDVHDGAVRVSTTMPRESVSLLRGAVVTAK
ncbi:MAG TPA: hypothetical protein VJS11_14625 [Acidobacteriaceae bacterium]|nr:hypothetical protein [Acidobacteriaceae bacterium]